MKQKRYGTLYYRLAGLILLVILISAIIPPLVFTHFSRQAFSEDVRRQVIQNMENTRRYLEQAGRPPEEIEQLLSNEMMHVQVLEDLSGLELQERQLKTLAKDQVLFFTRPGQSIFHDPLIILGAYQQEYVLIELDIGPVFRLSHRSNLLAVLFSLLLGLLISALVGYRLLKPVKRLEAATRKVAAGDFSVQIPAPRQRDEIASLVESFNRMIQELRSVEILRGNFVSDISHEFKTPLTAIEGYAKLLEADCSPEEQKEYIQIINEEAHRLSRLADNILMLNRIEKGNISTQRERVRLDEQIRRALMLYEPKWAEKRLELDLELEEIFFQGYESLLMQVWSNLIENAVKFSPAGGKLRLSLVREPGEVAFTIADEGEGIPAEKQKHIFDKFYKADPSRTSEGNGLGLSIVRQVVMLHDGTIQVESQPGKGAVFTIRLPEIMVEEDV